MAPGCAEWLDPEFIGWVWNFNKNNRKRYHALLAQQAGKTVHIFKNRRQLRAFLETV